MGWFSQFFSNEQIPPDILPGKNDPCWCGSGTKYKKCHLLKDKLYFKEHPIPKKRHLKKMHVVPFLADEDNEKPCTGLKLS